MADLLLLEYSDDYSDYRTKINAGLTKENTIYNGLDGGADGDVPRKINGTDFNYEFVQVPTLKAGESAKVKVRLAIGDWDMDTDSDKDVAHGLNSTQWKTMTVIRIMIRNDADDKHYTLERVGGAGAASTMGGGVNEINSTNIKISRVSSGFFDSNTYNNTGYDRGWIDIEYIP